MALFFLKVWSWIKKYWKWLLFPIGVLAFFIGRATAKRNFTVVNPELHEADKKAREAQKEADREAGEAKTEKDEKVSELKKEHAETLEKLTDEQKERVEELEDEPDALNEFLLGVGKDIRG